MAQKAELYTQGLTSSAHLVRDHSSTQLFHPSLYLSSHCLHYNLEAMFDLWSNLLASPKWDDVEHIKTLLLSVRIKYIFAALFMQDGCNGIPCLHTLIDLDRI